MKKGERNVLAGAKTGRHGSVEAGVADFVRQRKDDVSRVVRERRARQVARAAAISDTRIRHAFEREQAQADRELQDFWRRFSRKAPAHRDGIARHRQNRAGLDLRYTSAASRSGKPYRRSAPPSGAGQLAAYGAPVIDRQGRRGVYLSATYLSARTAGEGCARRLARYVTAPDHVEHDPLGHALTGSNVGETRGEVSAAFGLVEELNRAARTNAKIVHHLIVQLPQDVSPEARARIMRTWCEDRFGVHDLPFVWAVHMPDADGDQRNCHGHVAASFRPLVRVAPFCWDAGREVRAELDNPQAFRVMREQFAETMTQVCQDEGHARVYTGLSHAARGLKIKPTEHLGAHKTRLVRTGHYVAADVRNHETIRRNEALLEVERLQRRQVALKQRLARVRAAETRIVQVPMVRTMVPQRPATTLTAPPTMRSIKPPHPVGIVVPNVRHGSTIRACTAITQPTMAIPTSQAPVGVVSLPTAVHRPVPIGSARISWMPGSRQPASMASGGIAIVPLPQLVTAAGAPSAMGIPVAERPAMSAPSPVSRPLPRLRPDRSEIPELAPTVVRRASAPDDRHRGTVAIPMVRGAVKLLDHPIIELPRTIDPALPPPASIDPALLDLALRASAARRRAKIAATRTERTRLQRRVLAMIDRMAWPCASTAGEQSFATVDSLDATPALDSVAVMAATAPPSAGINDGPNRPLASVPLSVASVVIQTIDSAATPAPSMPARDPATVALALIASVDAYVFDDGAGRYLLDPSAAARLRIADAVLDGPEVQAGLAAIRADQQHIFAQLAAEAAQRPLAFAKIGRRPWPRDLAPDLLVRLDRWAGDEGFGQDLFFAVALPVAAAHEAAQQRERQRRKQQEMAAVSGPPRLPQPVDDGFGGTRDTPPPVHRPGAVGARLHAFNADGGATLSLLLLLRHAGEHPRTIEIAEDGRITGVPPIPALIAPLIDQWRHDDHVHALVVATVQASRAAGRPVWPLRHAAAIRAGLEHSDGPAPAFSNDREITR